MVTNVGTRWRNRFADRAHQVDEVLTIADGLPTEGWVLLGEGDEDLVGRAKAVGRALVQGRSPGLPSYRPPLHGPDGARFGVTFPGGESALAAVKTISDEILSDVELAISAATLLGTRPYDITAALQDYTPTATRMEIWRSPVGVTMVRDVASPDPMAVSSAVRTARRLAASGGRTVVVLAEPAPSWEGTAVELAEALHAEGADEVCAVATGHHEHVAEALAGLGPGPRPGCSQTSRSCAPTCCRPWSTGTCAWCNRPPGH